MEREYLFDLNVVVPEGSAEVKISTLVYKYQTSTGSIQSDIYSFVLKVDSNVGEVNSEVVECQMKF